MFRALAGRRPVHPTSFIKCSCQARSLGYQEIHRHVRSSVLSFARDLQTQLTVGYTLIAGVCLDCTHLSVKAMAEVRGWAMEREKEKGWAMERETERKKERGTEWATGREKEREKETDCGATERETKRKKERKKEREKEQEEGEKETEAGREKKREKEREEREMEWEVEWERVEQVAGSPPSVLAAPETLVNNVLRVLLVSMGPAADFK